MSVVITNICDTCGNPLKEQNGSLIGYFIANPLYITYRTSTEIGESKLRESTEYCSTDCLKEKFTSIIEQLKVTEPEENKS